jgi:DNA-binding transcriptional MerR regulator
VWTLDELVARVGAALETEYPGAPNGRVRDVPDRRAIRWYATRGLVDRPSAMRGRVALYGPRHLLQLVALKRRQAEGRTLAEIQAELAGAPDETLASIAAVPADLMTADSADGVDDPVPARPRFWAAPVAAAAVPAPVGAADALGAADAVGAADSVGAGGVGADGVGVLTGVPLPGGAVLLVPGRPDAGDVAAIRAAAQHLTSLLDARGLLTPRSSS